MAIVALPICDHEEPLLDLWAVNVLPLRVIRTQYGGVVVVFGCVMEALAPVLVRRTNWLLQLLDARTMRLDAERALLASDSRIITPALLLLGVVNELTLAVMEPLPFKVA